MGRLSTAPCAPVADSIASARSAGVSHARVPVHVRGAARVARLLRIAMSCVAAGLPAACTAISLAEHDARLWRWYRTTDLEAERSHLAGLRVLTNTTDPPAGLRLERAFHERRIGDPSIVPALLRDERMQHPAAGVLISALAERWGVEELADPAAVGEGRAVRLPERVFLIAPTIDATAREIDASGRQVRVPSDRRLPVAAFDAAAWFGAFGPERYIVPIQISMEILDDVDWSWAVADVDRLPAAEIRSRWGIGRVIVVQLREWKRLSPYAVEYEVAAEVRGLEGSVDAPDGPSTLVLRAETMRSVARAEPRAVLTGDLLADNPLGIENERIDVGREQRPLDEDEFAMGLQRGLLYRVLNATD